MGKIFFFLIAGIVGLMYYFKDASLTSLSKTSKEVQTESPKKDGEFQPKWAVGTCLYFPDDQWNYEKITFASQTEYKYITCRKFKGCTTEVQSYPALAYEKDRYNFTAQPCQ